MTRRGFVGVSAAALMAGLAVPACTGADGADTQTASGPGGDGGSSSLTASGDASSDGGVDDGAACEVDWDTIPDQAWIVGVPVEVDLAPYLAGADAAALGIALEGALPAGVTLQGTVLTGTPMGPFEGEVAATVEVAAC